MVASRPSPRQRRERRLLVIVRLHLTFTWQLGRRLRLRRPRTFNEWVQHRKLHNRDPRLPSLLDKVAVKAAVARRLGADWITPTLWHGAALPDTPPGPLPIVLKGRHGCGQLVIVRTAADWPRARRLARHWTRARYGRWLDEWAYRDVPLGLLAEPLLGDGRVLPIDYKLFVFGGRVAFVQVHLDRATNHRWIVMDLNWRRVSPPTSDPDPSRPASLPEMIAGAETLSQGYDFLRVDLYEVAGKPRFGEITIYPGSGLLPVVPASLDRRMGELWRAARQERGR